MKTLQICSDYIAQILSLVGMLGRPDAEQVIFNRFCVGTPQTSLDAKELWEYTLRDFNRFIYLCINGDYGFTGSRLEMLELYVYGKKDLVLDIYTHLPMVRRDRLTD